MSTKYKLSELAKDLKLSNAEVIEALSGPFGAKKTGAALAPEEVNYILEMFTQKTQAESFDAYFADKTASKAPEKPVRKTSAAAAAEAPAAKEAPKPAEKPTEKPAEKSDKPKLKK